MSLISSEVDIAVTVPGEFAHDFTVLGDLHDDAVEAVERIEGIRSRALRSISWKNGNGEAQVVFSYTVHRIPTAS